MALLFNTATSEERSPVCSDETAAKDNVERLDADLVKLRDERKQREAESERQIHKAANALVASGKWTEEQRTNFFANIVKSKEFVDFEKQKKSDLLLYGLAAQTFVTRMKQSNLAAACTSAEDMRRLLNNIGTINDRQYAHMLAAVKRAAAYK